jgi:hypothetical protein
MVQELLRPSLEDLLTQALIELVMTNVDKKL